ncbi:MAG: hypothetical protein ACKO43_07380 [Alphaproteobacteria bacterium]
MWFLFLFLLAFASAPAGAFPFDEATLRCLQSQAQERQLSSAATQWQTTESLIRGDSLSLTFQITFQAAIRHEEAIIALNEQHKQVFQALQPYFLKPDQAYERFVQDFKRYDRQIRGCQPPTMPPPDILGVSASEGSQPLSSTSAMGKVLQSNPNTLGPLKTNPFGGAGISIDPKLLDDLLARMNDAEEAGMMRAQMGASLTSLMDITTSGVTDTLTQLNDAGLTLNAMQTQVPACFPAKTPDSASVFSERFSRGIQTLLNRPLPFDSSGLFYLLGCQTGVRNPAWLLPENRGALVKNVIKQHQQLYDATTLNWMAFQDKMQRQDYALRRQQRALAQAEETLAKDPSLKTNTLFMSALQGQRQSVADATNDLKTMKADYDRMVPPSVAKAEAEREDMATFFMTLGQSGLDGLSPAPLSLAQRKANLQKKAAAYMPLSGNDPNETPRVLEGEIRFAKAYAAKAQQFLDYYTQNPDYLWNPRILNIACAISTKIKDKQAELAAICPKSPPAPR